MLQAYINGMGNVSPQPTVAADTFLANPITYDTSFLWAQEPDYKNYIQSGLVRRMSHVVRMSLAASHIALQEAGDEPVDAIVTGTALGCLQDTEKFLSALIENEEQMLTPTAFVQSTHNTVGGQIALLRQNTCYNMTYTHRGFSFESALLDALMRMAEGQSKCALVGAADELTKFNEVFFGALGCLKSGTPNNMELLAQNRRILAGEAVELTDGTLFGEGATFFALSPDKKPQSQSMIAGLRMCYKPSNYAQMETEIKAFLAELNWNLDEVDAVLLGNTGDARFDDYYHQAQKNIFASKSILYYKHLCGEYSTSTAFAMWLAAQILHKQEIPEVVWAGGKQKPTSIRKILIYNHLQCENHSLIALSVC